MDDEPISRRALLRRTARALGAVAAARLAAGAPPASAVESAARAQSQLPDRPHSPGAPASPYGHRSRFETSARTLYPAGSPDAVWSYTPLADSRGIITPAALHFERHHAGVPAIDPARHRLLIHGEVKRPLVFTVDEVKRFPSVSRMYFIECSGNSLFEWAASTAAATVQESHGLTSCSEWTGVRLALLLREVGASASVSWIVAEGADAAVMTRSIPMEKCLDDVIVAWGQNGGDLRPEQGYPLRLVVPGFEGNMNIKWLRRIKVVREPYQTREETSKYTDLMPDGKARRFTFVMEAKSVITWPSGGQTLAGRGFYEITGLAWSGRGRITAVDVSVDGGGSWARAELGEPVLPKCHTRFRLPWVWNGERAELKSRCVDETGYVQPCREDLVKVRGLSSVYHYNGIQSWVVTPDGRVSKA